MTAELSMISTCEVVWGQLLELYTVVRGQLLELYTVVRGQLLELYIVVQGQLLELYLVCDLWEGEGGSRGWGAHMNRSSWGWR